MFEQLRTAHIAVFVISLAWGLLLWLGLVRPMLRRSGKESRQIAEMLSQLPAEMDVEALVGQALVKTGVCGWMAGAVMGAVLSLCASWRGILGGCQGYVSSDAGSGLQPAALDGMEVWWWPGDYQQPTCMGDVTVSVNLI